MIMAPAVAATLWRRQQGQGRQRCLHARRPSIGVARAQIDGEGEEDLALSD